MKKIRIQFEVSEEGYKGIEALMKKSGLTQKKKLLNNALSLFEWAIGEVESGRIITSMDEKAGKYRQLLMVWMSNVKRR